MRLYDSTSPLPAWYHLHSGRPLLVYLALLPAGLMSYTQPQGLLSILASKHRRLSAWVQGAAKLWPLSSHSLSFLLLLCLQSCGLFRQPLHLPFPYCLEHRFERFRFKCLFWLLLSHLLFDWRYSPATSQRPVQFGVTVFHFSPRLK